MKAFFVRYLQHVVGLATGFALLLGAVVVAPAEEAKPDPELLARIERLIQALDDDSYAVRERAEKELTAIGEPAREKLTAATMDASPERSQRAARALSRLPRPLPPEQVGQQLKMQMLALHNFHDTFRSFPSAYSTSRSGTPLLSWRVAILPFLGEKALYDEFRMDEPWDSEHNRKLIERMPLVFQAPGSKAEAGKTVYLGVGGENGVLVAPRRRAASDGDFSAGVRMADITDGTSNTLAIVEASDELAVAWTKPEAWVPDDKDAIKGLVGLRPDGFQAGLCDGSVRLIPRTLDGKTLPALFTRSGGEVFSLPSVDPGEAILRP